MSISIHIPFYNPLPEKKEGYRQLRRFDYLNENILNLKKLSIKSDIFIHTHNNFLNDKNLDAKIIIHNLNQENLDKGHLTWLTRPLMEKQKNDYEYFMYLEHDIKFSEENFEYFINYKNTLDNYMYHLGFLIYEKNQLDNNNYCVHVIRKLNKFIHIKKQNYFLNDFENYCCFWIYDQNVFKRFIESNYWSFKNKLTNFRHNYGITERSALGFHAFNINYFNGTLIPVVDNKPDPRCFIEHMTNNYFDKFNNVKGDSSYLDIRGVCKFKSEEVFENIQNCIELENYKIIFDKYIKKLIWKFRFITRLFKS